MTHLVFFDPTCKLCQNSVAWILRHDRQKIFLFAPIMGRTAKEKFGDAFEKYQKLNTLVLIEAPSLKIWMRGKAVFRILWLLGGRWAWIGFFHFLPGSDFGYRLIAKHRHRLNPFIEEKHLTQFRERFLP